MGASESTARSNGTNEEEERQQPTAEASIAAAVAGVAAVGVAAWGISRMLSDDTDSQQKQDAIKFRVEPSNFSSSNSSRGTHEPYPTSNSSRLLGMHPMSSTPSGPFKMETSGACHSDKGPGVNLGPSGYGGILRDGRGRWVRGFLGFIGENDALTTEFHGILKGLQLLVKLGHVGSILESDHEQAVDWINNNKYISPTIRSKIIKDCWVIIQECKNLKQNNNIQVKYCGNDQNSAYSLATIAIYEKESYAEIKNLNDSNIPSAGRYKMETSRACKSKPGPGVRRGPSGYGGILRDGRGNWVKGFRGFIADIDSLTAEFHAILKGLQLLDKLDHVDSILESDYKPAVDWIKEEERSYPDHSEVIDKEYCWKIIEECRRLKNKNRIKVDYRPREYKNNEPPSVYKLARIAISEGDSYVEFMTPPDGIS